MLHIRNISPNMHRSNNSVRGCSIPNFLEPADSNAIRGHKTHLKELMSPWFSHHHKLEVKRNFAQTCPLRKQTS